MGFIKSHLTPLLSASIPITPLPISITTKFHQKYHPIPLSSRATPMTAIPSEYWPFILIAKSTSIISQRRSFFQPSTPISHYHQIYTIMLLVDILPVAIRLTLCLAATAIKQIIGLPLHLCWLARKYIYLPTPIFK